MLPISSPRGVSESSSLISKREPFAPDHNWKSIADLTGRSKELVNTAGVLSRKLVAPAPSYDTDLGFHPFKVYTVPASWRQTYQPDFDLSKNWRTVRVRGGLVFNPTDITGMWGNGSFGLVKEIGVAGGYDRIGAHTDVFPSEANTTTPYAYSATSALQPTDIEIEAGWNEYYIYAELVSYTHEASPPDFYQVAIKGAPYNNAWEGSTVGFNVYPRPNPYIWPLAIVDTRTWPEEYTNPYNSISQTGISQYAIIKQIQFEHINLNRPPSFWGEWSASRGMMSGNNYLPLGGYPLNAIVTRDRTVTSTTLKATYLSRSWFNTDTPGASSKWQLIGEARP